VREQTRNKVDDISTVVMLILKLISNNFSGIGQDELGYGLR
jgi:hypothetical protein